MKAKYWRSHIEHWGVVFPLRDDCDGFYPTAQLSTEFPGFYRIPIETDFLAINRDGVVIRLTTGKKLKIHISSKGYPAFGVRNKDGSSQPTLVHRTLALLFVPVPVRHLDKSRDDLQVNHIDGDKTNFSLDNLEWVTGQENMEHAFLTGLADGKRPVLARNIVTNEIVRYESIRACCQEHLVDKNMLLKHLTSISSGRIIKDSFVFKFDDGALWPDLLAYPHSSVTLWRTCNVVGKEVSSGEIHLFASLGAACEILGFSLKNLGNHRHRVGSDSPYQGWIFYPLSGETFRNGWKK